jgi:hypothetical protein
MNGEEPQDFREQIYSPSGASAGPFGVTAARMPDLQPQGGGAADPMAYDREGGARSGGGGGGGTSPMYDNLRAKGMAMASKLKGYGGGGGYSSGYSDYGNYKEPKYEEPELPKNKGFSRRYEEEPLAEGIFGNPSAILPEIYTGRIGDPGYQYLRDLPADDLTMLTAGTKGKSWLGKTKTDRATGYEYQEPNKTGKYVNALTNTYQGILDQSGDYLDPYALQANMLSARRKSSLGSQFTNKVDAADQTYQMGNYINTIGSLMPQGSENMYVQTAQNKIDAWGNNAMKRKKPGSLLRYLRREGM